MSRLNVGFALCQIWLAIHADGRLCRKSEVITGSGSD